MYSAPTIPGIIFATIIISAGVAFVIIGILIAFTATYYQRARQKLLIEIGNYSPSLRTSFLANSPQGKGWQKTPLEQYAESQDPTDSVALASAKQTYVTLRQRLRALCLGLGIIFGFAMCLANILFLLAILGIIELTYSIPFPA